MAALDRAELALEDCRSGASRLAGVPGLRPDNPEFLAGVSTFAEALRTARRATEARLAAASDAEPAVRIRQRQAMHKLGLAAAELDLVLSRAVAGRLRSQSRLLTVLVSLWGALALGLTGLVWTAARHRVAAEEQVRSGLDLLRTIVERAQVSIVVRDKERRVRLWNAFAESTFGRRREEVLGRVWPSSPPEMLAQNEELWSRCLGGEAINGVEVRRYHKDGAPVELSLHMAPIRNAAGEVTAMVTVSEDVTERKRQVALLRESEERYRQVVENSPLGIFIQVDDRFHYLNAAAVTLFGATSAAELIGTPPSARYADESCAALAGRIRALREGGGAVEGVEATWIGARGEPMTVRVSAVPYRGGGGDGALVFFADITEVRRANEERRKMEERLAHSQRMESIGRLAGGVAHDFNNLLTVIHGYADFLESDLPHADRRRDHVREIRAASERAASLTKQLLAFGRRQVSAPAAMDLNDVVREAEKMLRRLIGEDLRLEVDLGRGLWPVCADSGQMHQVLLNLAVNARDALPAGGRISISTRNRRSDEIDLRRHPEMAPADCVELTFADDGPGIPDDVIEHIFEPFFTTKPVGAGTGLGLSIVYGVVRQNGGSIAVESAPGRGATFQMLLPAAPDAEPRPAAPPARAVTLAAAGETILVVEDNAEVRRYACEVLRRCGYNVLDAADAGAAFAILDQHREPIHLLLTDVVLPGATGKDLSGYARTVRPETRCLFMSGYAADIIGRHGVMESGPALLEKPFTPEELSHKVRSVLGSPECETRSESGV